MTTQTRELDDRKAIAKLWFGVFGGPFAWALHLQLNYALVGWACANDAGLLLHAIAIAAILITIASAFAARSSLRRLERSPLDVDRVMERRIFMAKSGVILSLFFVLVIFAHEIPNLILRPCAW